MSKEKPTAIEMMDPHFNRSKVEIAANSTLIIYFYEPHFYEVMSTNSALFQLLEKRKQVAQIALLKRGSEDAKQGEQLFEELNTRIKDILGL